MNPYFYAAVIGAASALKRPPKGHKSSTAVRRRAVIRPRPRPIQWALKRERRSLMFRVGIIGALMITVIVGLILFRFAWSI